GILRVDRAPPDLRQRRHGRRQLRERRDAAGVVALKRAQCLRSLSPFRGRGGADDVPSRQSPDDQLICLLRSATPHRRRPPISAAKFRHTVGMTATPELYIDGPALVFGGPYSNLQATAAVLDEAARRGIPPS